jgi:hypothetical protein
VTCAQATETLTIPDVRDVETVDCELRLLVAVRRVCREEGGPLRSIGVADALLDERGVESQPDDFA